MEPFLGPNEGPGPDQTLFNLYQQFEELCEIEGPGAADEGDLCRLRHEMTDAWIAGDSVAFLGILAEAMSRRDGTSFDDPTTFSH
jgi:hypothetical protein